MPRIEFYEIFLLINRHVHYLDTIKIITHKYNIGNLQLIELMTFPLLGCIHLAIGFLSILCIDKSFS